MIRIFALILPALLLSGCFSQPPAPAYDRTGTIASRAPAAAEQPSGPGYYTVKRGDTLYRIALEHGLDYNDLAAWNGLSNPAAIKEGLVLRVQPPVAAESGAAVVSKPIGGGVVEARPLDQPAAPAVTAATIARRDALAGKEPYSDEAYARLNKIQEAPKAPDAVPGAPAAPAAPTTVDDVAWMWPSSAKVSAPYSDASNKGLDFAGRSGDPVVAAADGKVVYAGSGLRGYGELVIVKHNATYLSAYAHNRKILVKEGQAVSRGQKIAEMGNTDADSVKLHFEIRKQGKPVDPAPYLPKR